MQLTAKLYAEVGKSTALFRLSHLEARMRQSGDYSATLPLTREILIDMLRPAPAFKLVALAAADALGCLGHRLSFGLGAEAADSLACLPHF